MDRDIKGRYIGKPKFKSTCIICKEDIYDYRKRRVCSAPKKCLNILRSVYFKDKNPYLDPNSRKKTSFKMMGMNNPRWKGGRIYSNGWVMIKMREHPNCNHHGYIFEHRIVMEKYLNRVINKEEVVHHINGIKDDNRIENLKLLTQSGHLSLHQLNGEASRRLKLSWNKRRL